MKQSIVKIIRSAPKDPGVYIFYGKKTPPRLRSGNKEALYVGKAANLKNRLKSYLKITDLKTQSLNEEANRLSYIPLRSEIEALIEESRLIKELKPKYNILWRDDKSYLYVAITRHSAMTRNSAPKIFITHKNSRLVNSATHKLKPELIGPFTDGNALRLVMKILRRYFPYCTCIQPHLRDCLNAQIGRCLGFCCKKYNANAAKNDANAAKISQDSHYAKNLRSIKMILRGQSKQLLETLEKPEEREALEKIFEHRDYVRDDRSDRDARNDNNSIFDRRSPNISRVECYDISNFAGKEAVGAMTVLIRKQESENRNQEWVADKSQWRKFKIKSSPTRDDPRMIYEVVSRRLNHPEWPYPDLIIIDGGITQLSAAQKAISNYQFLITKKIKIIGFAKPNKQIVGWGGEPSEELQKLAERAIYQTHNFVIRYHRKVRNKALFAIM